MSDEEIEFIEEEKKSAKKFIVVSDNSSTEEESETEEASAASSNKPSGAECLSRCKEFAKITGTDSALAMFYLQDNDWDLEVDFKPCTKARF